MLRTIWKLLNLHVCMCIKRNSKRSYKMMINFSKLGVYGATCRCRPRRASKFRWQIRTGDGRSRRGRRLCSCDEEEACRTLRAMCEASRGRQLRLIRAETDSGRSDGLLNTLTCRQPSARLHFLHPSPFASFTTWPNFVPVVATHAVAAALRNYCRFVRSHENVPINRTYFFYNDTRTRDPEKRFSDNSLKKVIL